MTRPPAPTVTRCAACGGWTWAIDQNGCPTCRRLWAVHGHRDIPTRQEDAA